MSYYDGTKLLSMKDIDGLTPEIFMVTTNRTGGKTTYFNRLGINRFIKNKSKFVLLYRFNYELDDVADKFFNDIQELFFNDYTLKVQKRAKNKYAELYLMDRYTDDGELCGWAMCINDADAIKKMSHLFTEAEFIIFDEFQSETNHYCDNEINKFISIHTSLARGHGKQVRYLPVYMIANPVSIINPYYVAFGISDRLQKETKFLRGQGWVLEQGYNETAADMQKQSGFNKAFGLNKYVAYAGEGIYLNDNLAFIEKMTGKNRYIATLKYNDKNFALREYDESGIIYVDKNIDSTYPHKISVTTNDHNINYVILKRNELFIINMRYLFEKGCFRFRDLECKECILKLLSY